MIASLIRRDTLRGLRAAGLPVMFFLIAATLFPFAVGPDARVLTKAGGGMLWLAALLAALLPIERLVAPDIEAGVFDQFAARGIADEALAAAKIAAHWLSFGPTLMLAALPGAALLGLDESTLGKLEAGLAIGTPALAALGLTVAALTAGLRGGGALAGLVLLPLAIPLLIFGAGALDPDGAQALKLLASTALLLTFGAPFAAGAALRSHRD
ncbi:heme exporter protein CcmB [Sphingomonas sp. CGMCC 1.13654]|uniref:Heme exporter protein B n=1 Tax=Sphingomonas chungangi TaxID=2683589 RepID=A0A838L7M9_9SPHN|nr:heme exporter protein CcmB [Sphingomonas chungangi]MBA2934705.1 heme exporter protein CcmB [Sphingomonas chungangi]MVW58016.1 heme ABC transporter permease CcmB [Sphingomonas chungangi]